MTDPPLDGARRSPEPDAAEAAAHWPTATELLQLTPDSVIVRDLADRILAWNAGAEALYGWSSAAARGQLSRSLLETQSLVPEAVIAAELDKTGHWTGELNQRRQDGTRLVVASRQLLRRDDQGQPLAILEMNRDLTAQRQLESVWQASQARLQRVVDAAVDGIAIVDLDGRITFANAAAEAIYGLRRSGITGRTYNDPNFKALHLDGRPLAPEDYAFARVRRTGAPVHGVEYYIEHPDGRQIILSIDAAPLFDGAGQMTDVVACLRDVTERRRAEAQLAAQYRVADAARSESRAILDATSEAMILVSPDHRVLSANRRVGDLLGGDPANLTGRAWADLEPLFGRAFTNSAEFEQRVRNADPEQQFTEILLQEWPRRAELQLFSTPVRGNQGELIGRLHVFRDITQEREIDRMKSEFVSLVSHELRTPLTSIQGYVDLVLTGEVGELNEEQQDFLRVAQSNTRRLVALINDLLDLSRIESGRIELQLGPIDLDSLIPAVVRSLRPHLEQKDHVLRLEIADDLPEVLADTDRLTQILTNLLSNAIKYTPAGGRLTIAAEQIGEAVQIAVSDSGIGLTPAEQTELFTKFFRANHPVVQAAVGTGLGLTITRSLVEMHGGTLTVASVAGAGSTFAFTLPHRPPAAPATDPAGSVKRVGPTARVLVVEDEPDIARLIQRYLERAGYQAEIVRTGAEAQAWARRERPDLITLDLVLPDLDGYTVLDRLKADPVTAAIPVLLLSSLPEGPRGRRLGAVDYLVKPISETVLTARLNRILSDSPAKTVLVVDDEADSRALLGHQLRAAGYPVSEAADGREAIDRIRHERPDIVLMDIRMPGLDGVAALREIRADPALSQTPVLMMTASPVAEVENRSLVELLGGTPLLRKPGSAEELVSAIRRCLEAID